MNNKKLDLKYSIPTIKAFLDIFDLTLDKQDEKSVLQIYLDDIQVC